MSSVLVISVVLCALLSHPSVTLADQDPGYYDNQHESHAYAGHYTNEFAVELDGDLDVAELVAGAHGFNVIKQITGLGNIYQFTHSTVAGRSKRSADDLVEKLRSDPNVKYVEQQKILKRTKREASDESPAREKRRIIHDKQVELPIREYKDKSVYQRYYHPGSRDTKDGIPGDNSWVNEAGFNDPFYRYQWYLKNYGQTGGKKGYDVNVLGAWKKGFTGKGVVLSILDDGIDHTHPDLKKNYDPKASTDLNDKRDSDNDPMPNDKVSSNSHGTRCAGEISAEANNNVCGVGIAYDAKIGGVRLLDGTVTDMLEADALTYHNQHVDIYSSSWGPSDNGKTQEGPGKYASAALRNGVTQGRGGKGSLFIWATGNGGVVDDDCSCDGYVSAIETISIGCISDQGMSTYFSEVCPSTLACIFTGGSHKPPGSLDYESPKIKVVTTDLHADCTMEFQGTSSAAPLAAGCFALVLQSNPNLTWRDVQNIVVETARIPNSEEPGWMVNGDGYHLNHKFGFGALDCSKMVEVAQTWKTVPPQHVCEVPANNQQVDIPGYGSVNQTLVTSGCQGNKHIDRLEHVQLTIVLTHRRRGDLSIWLYSPMGTPSNMLSPRPLDDTEDGINFTFMTVHNWGEDPRGEWTLSVIDKAADYSGSSASRGRLLTWSLTLMGTEGPNVNADAGEAHKSEEDTKRDSGATRAHSAEKDEIEDIMDKEEQDAKGLHIQNTAKMTKTKQNKSLFSSYSVDDLEQLLRRRKYFDDRVNVNARGMDGRTDHETINTYDREYDRQKKEEREIVEMIDMIEDLIEKMKERGSNL